MSELAPGRYCLAVCYCGTCPHYQPLPGRGQTATTATRTPRQRDSWDMREESTWIDQM